MCDFSKGLATENAESIAEALLEKFGRMPKKVKLSQLMSVDDIELNLEWFLERAEQGLWNEDDFWDFWDKEVSKSLFCNTGSESPLSAQCDFGLFTGFGVPGQNVS